MGKRKLGRGLHSLLGVADGEGVESALVIDAEDPSSPPGESHQVALIDLDPNPYQPRKHYDPEDLAQLAQSISVHGVIQPIVVRPCDGRFQIVAGERRFRAAQEAGLTQIPARVIELDDQQTFEIALIENLQRRDLNPMEKAQAFQGYIGQFQVTHEELAAQIGVDRTTVTNLIRLLELPESVQDAVRVGQITFGHARALLSLDNPSEQVTLCRRIIAEALSVRQTEDFTRERRADKPPKPEAPNKPAKSNHLLSLENDLRHRLGAKVDIRPKSKDKGSITIHFDSNDDFERLISYLTKP